MPSIESRNQIYAQAFLNAKEGLILSNDKGEIEEMNPAAVEMFAYKSPNELVGKKVEVLIPRDRHKDHVKVRSAYAKQPHARKMGGGQVLNGITKGGEIIPLEISLSHFQSDENEMKILIFLVDVSERIKVQNELKTFMQDLESKVKERTSELEEALEKGKVLNNLKTRFVSVVSHEFRTPLSSIFSSATLLSKYTKTDQQTNRDKHINRIKSSVDNLINILNDILTINRVEEGMLPVSAEKVNIKKLAEELCEGMEAMADRGQKLFHSHVGDDYFVTDKKLFQNIGNNVVSNALKYSFDDGEIFCETKVKDGVLTIRVQDAGIGIPVEDQEKLFQRFFRAANAANIEGTGLGLNIVKKYVELLKGEMTFTSVPDVKTEFIIKLPEHDND